MKGMDVFCASQASTAICLSMDHPSSSSSSSSSTTSTTTIQLGGRAIDRHNPIIRDGRRSTTRSLPTCSSVPCTSEPPPINPKPCHQPHKNKSNKKPSSKTEQYKKISAKPSEEVDNKTMKKKKKKKKNSDSSSSSSSKQPIINDDAKENSVNASDVIIKKRFANDNDKTVDFITPPASSRYLLSEAAFFDGFSDYYDPVNYFPYGNKNPEGVNHNEESINVSRESKASSSSSSPPPSASQLQRPSSDQVVVLRVSLHCKGCEGKVRKHLSRMEGVTSFNIDFAAKKVTIIGDVTPLGVLASVSKVKSAQFWPSSSSNLPTPAPNSTNHHHHHHHHPQEVINR